tara:strand:+ start:1478 stop:1702 length:225 start_codon:yes stop_codon:yes gene_type:complete
MVRKILDAAACIGLILSASLAGGSFLLYRYVSSPQFEEQVKEKIMGQVSNVVPKSIEKSLPKTTGISMPAIPKL